MNTRTVTNQNHGNTVSVIIPTRDSARTLATCLESIESQEGVATEIVIVDQESHDSTRDIASDYGAIVVNARRTDAYTPPSQSRNIGFSRSSGRYVLHLDSDMELSTPTLLLTCVDACESAHAVVIPEVDVGYGFWAKCKTMERQCHVGRSWLECPRFFRRSLLDTISGYNTKITSGEDWEITDRLVFLGARITRIPLFIRHHLGGFSLSKQAMKKYSYGKTMQNYVRLPNSQMSRRLGVYVSAYAGNLRHVGLYIYPVIFMRSVEALGMFAGMTLSTLKTETRRDKSNCPHPMVQRIPSLFDS